MSEPEGTPQWQQTSPQLWEKLKPLAREKRKNPTPAEAKLWLLLRGLRYRDLKFRRQHAIGRYIVDFYCVKAQLVIEVDGPIHEVTAEEDRIRQEYLEQLGLRVLRFTNDQVLSDAVGVANRIEEQASIEDARKRRLPLSSEGDGAGG